MFCWSRKIFNGYFTRNYRIRMYSLCGTVWTRLKAQNCISGLQSQTQEKIEFYMSLIKYQIHPVKCYLSHLWNVTCQMSSVTCNLSNDTRQMSTVICHLSTFTYKCHMSYFTSQMSSAIFNLSNVSCQISLVRSQLSFAS